MANPVIIDIPIDAWLKVATNVTKGQIHIIETTSQYLHTYRITTDPAPNGVGDGIRMSRGAIEIKSDSLIDVYIYCQEKDGKIRVDL